MMPGKVLPACALVLISWLWAATAWSLETLEEEVKALSRFQRTVNYLQGSPLEERADFAAAALAELTAVYMAEADLARTQAAEQEIAARGKLLAWSQAVDQYANQLLVVLDDVEQGFPVSLRSSSQGPVTATVADRAVILGHPRADQQTAYELRVLTDFCDNHNCERMTVNADEPEPIPASAMRVTTLWTFTEGGPVCSSDGIEVRFHSSQNLPILRGLCEELVKELAALSTDLAWQIRHGVAIDWDGLVISATPQRPEHLVRLNAAGDSILASLPLLYESTDLLSDVVPWLNARSTGSIPASIRLDADEYGWVPPPE
jgi:hypothetical protein